MNVNILVMGLPGSGKTTFAEKLVKKLTNLGFDIGYYNADKVRELENDWDFSPEGRQRQAKRMGEYSRKHQIGICDFVCPTEFTRKLFDPTVTIFMDTIDEGRFEDTNAMFKPPTFPTFTIESWKETEYMLTKIHEYIHQLTKSRIDWKKPTSVLIGRWQPFHDGHLALFREALQRNEQVCIMARDTQGTTEKDPLPFSEVEKYINLKLSNDFYDKYEVLLVPNVSHVLYGRDVGYTVENVKLDKDTEAISATSIRKELGI